MKHHALITRITATRSRVHFFDAELGHVVAHRPSWKWAERLAHGALVSYERDLKQDYVRIYGCAVLALPSPWVTNDLLFFHHVLELLAHLQPEHAENKPLFMHLMKLFEPPACGDEHLKLERKKFLCELITLSGCGVYEKPEEYYKIVRLISQPVDIMLRDHTGSALEEIMTRWLLQCVQHHVRAHSLKTIEYLSDGNS